MAQYKEIQPFKAVETIMEVILKILGMLKTRIISQIRDPIKVALIETQTKDQTA